MAIPLRLSLCPISGSFPRTATLSPSPTLVLRLANSSFLDGVLTSDGQPTYAFDTRDSVTSISRCRTDGLHPVASVHWPLVATDTTGKGKKKAFAQEAFVHIGAQHQTEDDFLRKSAFSSSRKFRVPGIQHSFKWRYVPTRDTYECAATHATTPLAIFEPAVFTACARLKIFGDAQAGMPDILLDHLVLTALLVTTASDDWRSVASPFSSPASLLLPAYSFLDSEYVPRREKSPASTAALSRASTLSTRSSVLRRTRSFCPRSSDSGFVSGLSSPISSPSSPVGRHTRLTLDTHVTALPLIESPLSAISSSSSADIDPWVWQENAVPAAGADEPPPPYDQIQFTVRVPFGRQGKH